MSTFEESRKRSVTTFDLHRLHEFLEKFEENVRSASVASNGYIAAASVVFAADDGYVIAEIWLDSDEEFYVDFQRYGEQLV